MIIKTSFQLEPKDISSTYSGHDGCACGCGGTYAEAISTATTRRLKKINDNLDQCNILNLPDCYIFELQTKVDEIGHGRVIRAYVPQNKLDEVQRETISNYILERAGL